MEYTAFNHNAWNPLHSIGMLWAMLHKIHCIQSRCIGPRCMDSTAYNRDPLRHNAWNPLHSMTLHGIHCIPSGCFGPCCIKSTAFNRVPFLHTAGNTMHSIGMHFNTLHGLHCCKHAAYNPLHSIGMIWAMLHKIHCIQSCCMESTVFIHCAKIH